MSELRYWIDKLIEKGHEPYVAIEGAKAIINALSTARVLFRLPPVVGEDGSYYERFESVELPEHIADAYRSTPCVKPFED
jgi:hypothetical protein